MLWDFGGVILESPFDGFARYEEEHGLAPGFLRGVIATDSDTNAWARLERGELDAAEFTALFEDECQAAGGTVDGAGVLAALTGRPRPEMVQAVRRCAERLPTGLVTNNFTLGGSGDARPELEAILSLFHVVVESSKVGLRKPDPRIYDMMVETLQVDPKNCVYLDDLGINLKPARAMGMTTIKVANGAQAIAELEAATGLRLG